MLLAATTNALLLFVRCFQYNLVQACGQSQCHRTAEP